MRTIQIALLVLAVLVSSVAQAEDEGPTVPLGARLRLEPERTTWWLGENIIVRYCIENTSAEPFRIHWGGDNRAVRATRFVVQVYDESGTLMPDPFPNPACFGGRGDQLTVRVSTPVVLEIPVRRYRTLDKPGRYRVRVFHDVSWGGWQGGRTSNTPPTDDPRWTETTIDVFAPKPADMDEILKAMVKLVPRGNRNAAQRNRPWSDFGMIYHPAYLAALTQRARDNAHESRWLLGVRSIPTRDATEALVGLLATRQQKDRAAGVAERLPVPTRSKQRRDFGAYLGFSRREMDRTKDTWDPALATRVRAAARNSVEGRSSWAHYAAYMLASVGTPDDLPALQEGIETGLYQLRDGSKHFTEPKTRLEHCYQAVVQLYSRGAQPPSEPKRPEEIALALLWLYENDAEGIERYGSSLLQWLQHDDAEIRALVLRCLPRPVPAQIIPKLGALLTSDDPTLRNHALGLIRDAKAAQFKSAVADQLAKASDQMWISAANGAAEAVSISRADRLRAHASAFGGRENFIHRWSYVTDIFESSGGGGSTPDERERGQLKERWLAFIAAHEEALNEGKRFDSENAAVQALIPSTMAVDPKR